MNRVEGPWWDKPIIIVGAGTSLIDKDLNKLKGAGHVIAVKGMMFDLPWADIGFGMDVMRFREWRDRFVSLPFPVYWAMPEDRIKKLGRLPANVIILKRLREWTISQEFDTLCCAGTSGFGALNLAILKGHIHKPPIYLFGFDYKSVSGQWHYSSKHYLMGRSQRSKNWLEWSQRYNQVSGWIKENGYKVWNVSPDSLITAFPKITYREALERLWN